MTVLRADTEILLALLLGLLLPATCLGQDDPFAVGRVPRVEQPVEPGSNDEPELSPELSEATKVVIRAVVESNPQTDLELGKAVKMLLDVEQYQQAKTYLAQLQAIATDDASLYRIYEALGSDFFLLIHGLPEMQPEGRDFAEKVLAAANKEAYQPARINDLIRRLGDPDISARSTAFRKLRLLGAPAVAEMIQVFADPNRRDEFPGVRSALRLMGNDALAPLLGASRADNPQVQADAIYALSFYPSQDATEVMMWTYLSEKFPESLRRIAYDSLMKNQSSQIDPSEVEQRFYQKARSYLTGKRKLAGGLQDEITVWQWNQQSARLQPIRLSAATASRLAAAERAADLYQINPDADRNRELFLLTQLEATKRLAGPSNPVDAGLVPELGTDANEIEAILTQALTLKLIPAATACCEILGEIGTTDLLQSFDNHPRALLNAMLIGDRHLQFAAFNAIAKLDPQSAYSGSSYMMMLAVYLASSEGRSAGLVGHVRPDIAQSYAATLSLAGLVGKSAQTGREFFREAVRNSDIDILLITDTLDNPNYGELIQQLRSDFRTKRLPIGFVFRNSDYKRRVDRLLATDPLLIALPISLEPEYVNSQVGRLQDLAKPWPVTDLERRQHAITAVNWLAKIASNRDAYPFYTFGGYEDELTRLIYSPGFVDSASKILVQLGTPAAQRELINFASQNGLPVAEREKAVAAFSKSVKIGGTLLTRKQILQQYDLYNASENDTPESQQVLGSILDAIESHARASD